MGSLRWVVCGCLALAACGGSGQSAAPGADAPIVSVKGRGADSAQADTPWTVTARGIGPVQAGMTTREALGLDVDVAGGAANTQTCEYVRAGRLPRGVGVMSSGGRVARVDVDSGAVATSEGARIGDSEARVRSLYPGRLREEPHKYTSGRNLVVTPSGDAQHRIIFETDGRVVTRFRAGRLPEVEWVERCG